MNRYSKYVVSQSLFELVHSLSRSEKRYFKLNAKTYPQKDSQFVQLFDFVKNCKTVDRATAALSRQPFFNSGSYASLESRLFDLILKVLRDYKSDRSPHVKLAELYSDVEILLARGQMEQAVKRAKRAKKIADENHLHLQYLQWLMFERRLFRRVSIKKLDKILRDQHMEFQKRLDYLRLETELLVLYEKIYLMRRAEASVNFSLSPAEEVWISFLAQEDLEKFPFEVRYLAHAILFMYAQNIGDNELALTHSKGMRDNHETLPASGELFTGRNMRNVRNMLNTLYRMDRFDELVLELKQLKKEEYRDVSLAAEKFAQVDSLELLVAISTGQIERAINMEPQVHKGLAKYKWYLSLELVAAFMYNMACAFFMAGQLDKAGSWLQRIFRSQRSKVDKKAVKNPKAAQAVYNWSYIMELIIAFRQKEYDWLENSLLKKTQSYLDQKNIDKNAHVYQCWYAINQSVKTPEDKRPLKKLLENLKKDNQGLELYGWLEREIEADSALSE